MSGHRIGTWLLLPGLLVFALAGAGCGGSRASSREALSPAARLAQLAPRLASATERGAASLEAGRLLLLELHDRPAAELRLREALADPAVRPDAWLLLTFAAFAARDYPALIDRGLPALVELAGDPRGEILLALLRYAEGNHVGFEDQVVPRLRELAAYPATRGELRWQIAGLLATSCLRAKDESCWEAQQQAAGFLRSWYAAGPYGLAPALDLLEPLAEEERLPEGCGPPATPSRAALVCGGPLFARDGELRCPQRVPGGGACLLETWVQVAAAGPVQLRVLSSDSFVLRLDGRELLRRDDFLRQEPALRQQGLQLAAGWHRLQLKLVSETGGGSVQVSLTDATGRALAVTVEPRPAVTPTSATWSPLSATEASTALSWLAPRAQAGDPDALLFQAFLQGEPPIADPELLLPAAQALLERLPGSAEARYRVAEALRQAPGLPSRVRQSRARQLYQEALRADPGHLLATYQLALLDLEADELEQARQGFDACLRLAPGYAWPLLRRAQIFRRWGWDAEARQDLARAAQLSPSLAVAREQASYWDEVGALTRRQAARQRLAELTPALASSEVARWAQDEGDFPRARQLWEARSRVESLSTAPFTEGVPLALGLGELTVADELLRRWEERDSLDPDLAQARVQRLLAGGEDAAAIARLEQALTRHPEDLVNQRLLAELTGRPLGGPAVDAVALLARYRAAQGEDPRLQRWEQHDLVVLLEQREDSLWGQGGGYRVVHRVSLVQTEQAADEVGEKRLSDEALLLQFRTIKADGTVLQPELGQGKDDLSFSGVEPGDLVEYRYVLPLTPDLPGGGFFDRYFVQFLERPIFLSELRVCVPAAETLAWRAGAGGAGEPLLEPAPYGRGSCWRWTRERVEPLQAEPAATPFGEWLPWVGYGYRQPADFPATLVRLLRDRLRRSSPVLPELALLLPTVLGPDPPAAPEERARRIHAWVRDEVRSAGHEGSLSPSPRVTLAERKGNRTLLLAALLREAGIPHRLLLARPLAVEQADPPLPELGWYFFPIIEVPRPAGPPLLLDAVSDKAPAGYLPEGVAGAPALQLAGEEPPRQRVPSSDPAAPRDRWRFELDLDLADDGVARGRLVLVGEGASTRGLRRALPALAEQERRALAERLLADLLPGIEVQGLSTEGLEDPDEPLQVVLELSSSSLAVRGEDGTLRIDRLLTGEVSPAWAVGATELARYLERLDRRLPLLVTPLDEELRLTLRLPRPINGVDGAAPLQLLLPVAGLQITQQVEHAGRVFRLHRHQQVGQARVSPASFVELKRLLLELDRVRTRALVFRLDATATN